MICPNCGKEHNNKRFCSRTCNLSYRNRYESPNLGKKRTEETKRKISESHLGELNPMYKSEEDTYQYDPTKPTSEYRAKAFSIYEYRCMCCGKTTGNLIVHHVDGNRDNNDIHNLSVLCRGCHNKAHDRTNKELIPEFRQFLSEIIKEVLKS